MLFSSLSSFITVDSCPFRVARSMVFDWTVWFLVPGLVDNFAQNRMCDGLVFYPIFYSPNAVFREQNVPKSFSARLHS